MTLFMIQGDHKKTACNDFGRTQQADKLKLFKN